MKTRLMEKLSSLLELFSPELCAACTEPVEYGRRCPLCTLCLAKWQTEKDSCVAENSGLPVIGFGGSGRAVFMAYYDPKDHATAADSLIFKLKHNATGQLLRFIAAEYREILRAAAPMLFDGSIDGSDVIVTWIPRRREAILKDGYDHMERCAIRLAELCGFRAERLIVRGRGALEQKRLDAAGRLANAGKSMLPNEKSAEQRIVVGKTVILLDDLVTTGASMMVGAKLITDMGARIVICAAIAANRFRK